MGHITNKSLAVGSSIGARYLHLEPVRIQWPGLPGPLMATITACVVGLWAYPLVNVYKKLWKITIFNGNIHYKW